MFYIKDFCNLNTLSKYAKRRVDYNFLCVRWVKDFFWGAILSHLYYYPVPSNLNYWASVRI